MLLKLRPRVRDSAVAPDYSEDEKQKFVLAQSSSVPKRGKSVSFFGAKTIQIVDFIVFS